MLSLRRHQYLLADYAAVVDQSESYCPIEQEYKLPPIVYGT